MESIVFDFVVRDDGTAVLRNAQQSLDALAQKAVSTGQKVSQSTRSWKELGTTLGGVATQAGIAATAVGGLVTHAMKTTVEWDQARRALKAAAGSTAEANRQFEAMVKLSKEPSLDLEPLLKNIPVLEQLGMSFDEASTLFLGMSRQMAMRGRGPDELNSALSQLTETIIQNKVQMDELRIMESRGVPVMQTLKSVYGLTSDQLSKLTEQGVSAKDLFAELGRVWANDAKAAKAAGEQSDSAANALTNFKTALKRLEETGFKQFLPVLTKFLTQVSERIESLDPDKVESFARSIVNLGIALGGLSVAGKGAALLTSLGGFAKMIGGGSAAAGAAGIGTVGSLGLLGAAAATAPVSGGAYAAMNRQQWGQQQAQSQWARARSMGVNVGQVAPPQLSLWDKVLGTFGLGGGAMEEWTSAPIRAGAPAAARPSGGGGTSETARRLAAIAGAPTATERKAAEKHAKDMAAMEKKRQEDAERAAEKRVQRLREERSLEQQKAQLWIEEAKTTEEKVERTEHLADVLKGQLKTITDSGERSRMGLEIRQVELQVAEAQRDVEEELKQKQADRHEADLKYQEFYSAQAQKAMGESDAGSFEQRAMTYAQTLIPLFQDLDRQREAAIGAGRMEEAAQLEIQKWQMATQGAEEVGRAWTKIHEDQRKAEEDRKKAQEQEVERQRRITDLAKQKIDAAREELRRNRELNMTLLDREAQLAKSLSQPQMDFAGKYLEFLKQVGGPEAVNEAQRVYQQVGPQYRPTGGTQETTALAQEANRRAGARISQLLEVGGMGAADEVLSLIAGIQGREEMVMGGYGEGGRRQMMDWLRQAEYARTMGPTEGPLPEDLQGWQYKLAREQAAYEVNLNMGSAVQLNIDPAALAQMVGQQAQQAFMGMLQQMMVGVGTV